MTTLMEAHTQWATRPDDERYTSLDDILADMKRNRAISKMGTQQNRCIEARPIEGNRQALALLGINDEAPAAPSHWAFGQLCSLIGAPASYLRTLSSDLASDCINQSMLKRQVETVGYLHQQEQEGSTNLRAVTGPSYGRIWNSDVVRLVIERFGTGPGAEFTVPGEFGQEVPITKANTTLFAGDRDMFVFLADERNRIEVPGRRDGQPGSLARGFFIRNSEVGASSLRIGTFLFDYVCANRIVWGAENVQEIAIRHSSRAPDRWMNEIAPALHQLAQQDTFAIEDAVRTARARRLDDDDIDKVLAKRFTTNQAKGIKLAHLADEGRPMETVWDMVTGATAYARGIKHQDARVDVERIAGALLAEAGR